MANVFTLTGKIASIKDSDKFHPIEKRSFSSGWENMIVNFNCISGTNRIPCRIQGGKWSSDSKNVIKTFSKTTTDENGNTVKGEKIDIPWSKRFDEDQIERVAGFRRFVCDTGNAKLRYKLQDAIEAFKNGNISDELMEEVGCNTLEAAESALQKSQAKRKIFLSEWDFSEHVAKLVASNKYKDRLFNISGTYDVQYNPTKQQFYTVYHVNRITLAADDAVPSAEMKLDFFFAEDAWDDSGFDETGKVMVNGWVSYYDSSVKKTGFKPTVIVVKESDEKKRNALKRKFGCDDGVKQIGLTVDIIDGAERVEITMDMLSEEEQEDIAMGLLDFEDVKRALGGSAIGDRVSELRFAKLTAGKGVQDTVYSVEDMHAAVMEQKDEDVNIDIFSDDEDDL